MSHFQCCGRVRLAFETQRDLRPTSSPVGEDPQTGSLAVARVVSHVLAFVHEDLQ